MSDPTAEWLAIAERTVALATAAGATEAEALVTAADARLTRFANSEIHQNVAETNADCNLRFVIGKRVGVASSGRVDDEGPAPARRECRGDRPERGRARGLGRPTRA